MIFRLAEVNPKATYWIFDDPFLEPAIETYLGSIGAKHVMIPTSRKDWIERVKKNPGWLIDEIPENVKYNGMKFDLVIGNPPYDRTLYLKILREAMSHVDFENGGEIVWLSPARWLQDPIAVEKKNSAYNKFKDIRDKLENVEIINATKAQQCFVGSVQGADLAICKLTNAGGFDCESVISDIVKKVLAKSVSWPTLEENKKDGWRVRFPLIIPGGSGGGKGAKHSYGFGKLFVFFDGKKDGKWWFEHYQANQFTKRTETITLSVKLESENEAKNFVDSLNTNFGRYFINEVVVDVHINPKMILWMNDCVNPRTGKKGYLGEWTDEDFFDYFELTEDERKIVRETMSTVSAK